MRFFRDLSRAKARRRLNVRGVVSLGSFRRASAHCLLIICRMSHAIYRTGLFVYLVTVIHICAGTVI